MKIQLPTKLGNPNTNPELEFEQLVVVGANGSGKTRFGSQIEQRNIATTHRISAQKSLTFPTSVSPSSRERARLSFLCGNYFEHLKSETSHYQQKLGSRWGQNPNTHLLNDFEKLCVLLHTEEYEDALSYKEGRISRPTTKLDRIQYIWEVVLPHRKLLKTAGTIEVYALNQEGNKYNAAEMSDGERVIFYLIGQVVCAPDNSIIIIDEPEMHIHKSLVKNLFDLIENERPDCTFVYLTHDIDFAFTRQKSKKIWTKAYLGDDIWDYEILAGDSPIPEQLYLEVLGSRKPVIFIEGNKSSIDYQLYQQVYEGHTLKPLGGCEKVIQSVKSFNDQNDFHHIDSFGITDRDRRQDGEISNLNSKCIWVLDVAEAENLLLIESVVKAISVHMGTDPEKTFSQVRENLMNFFYTQLESQIILHFKDLIKKKISNIIDVPERNLPDFIAAMDSRYIEINKQVLFDEIEGVFKDAVENTDYDAVLRLFNLKGALIPNSKVCELTGVRSKEEYFRLVLALLKKRDSLSNLIKQGIDQKIIKGINPFSVNHATP
jgi:ABC-type dipeptide/oligopeptide/nickel transport system ATPase component